MSFPEYVAVPCKDLEATDSAMARILAGSRLRVNLLASGRLKFGGHVAGAFEQRFGGLHGHEFDEFANAELLLPDDLDAEHVAFGIEIEHHEAGIGTVGLGADDLSFAEADISRRGLGIDLDDGRLGDRDDEPASSSIR